MEFWAVDCHVHLYAGYEIDSAVHSSWKNVRMPNGSKPAGQCWCLASPPGIDGVSALKSLAEAKSSKTRLISLQDSRSMATILLESEEGPIVVVPGTQAISAEGLEVLSLGAELPRMRKTPLNELINQVIVSGGLPVLPWGVGKWLGRRGRLVSSLANTAKSNDSLVFADNANRPWWWPYPGLLRKALADGLIVVSGSDPLPINGDEQRIASAGIFCRVRSVRSAWEDTRHSIISSRNGKAETYGRPMSNSRFWRNQFLLRMHCGQS